MQKYVPPLVNLLWRNAERARKLKRSFDAVQVAQRIDPAPRTEAFITSKCARHVGLAGRCC